MKPYRSTRVLYEWSVVAPACDGTVPRGFLRADKEFSPARKPTQAAQRSPAQLRHLQAASQQPILTTLRSFHSRSQASLVARGRERYEIFCSVCHGMTGNGDGMIVRRGFRRAASFHTDALRQAPVGHYLRRNNKWLGRDAFICATNSTVMIAGRLSLTSGRCS